jgi:hypothetical protein
VEVANVADAVEELTTLPDCFVVKLCRKSSI